MAFSGWRLGWEALWLSGATCLAGCYVTRPVTTAPAPGSTILLDLSDAGRQALGERIGSSAASVEGRVTAVNGEDYLLRVLSVTYLNGQNNQWSGESLAVPLAVVTQARSRQLSRSRTIVAGAGLAAGLVVLAARASFLGTGSGGTGPTAPPTGRNWLGGSE
jgi:hypothetical protein